MCKRVSTLHGQQIDKIQGPEDDTCGLEDSMPSCFDDPREAKSTTQLDVREDSIPVKRKVSLCCGRGFSECQDDFTCCGWDGYAVYEDNSDPIIWKDSKHWKNSAGDLTPCMTDNPMSGCEPFARCRPDDTVHFQVVTVPNYRFDMVFYGDQFIQGKPLDITMVVYILGLMDG